MTSFLFEPRIPLSIAELHVDFPAHYDHVTSRRATVERAGQARSRRVAAVVAETGIPPAAQVDALAISLERSLGGTARFGYLQARREIRSLRASHPRAVDITDAGRYGTEAAGGLERIRQFIGQRAREAAIAVAAAAVLALRDEERKLTAPDLVAAIVAAKTLRSLHNHVLELVGETLNLGRAAGALSVAKPPEFSLRSEQLDKRTCSECERLHGEITVLDSPQFYALLPPAGCFGGGRCRGVVVFADRIDQTLRGPETEPGPQPPLPYVPPVAA